MKNIKKIPFKIFLITLRVTKVNQEIEIIKKKKKMDLLSFLKKKIK